MFYSIYLHPFHVSPHLIFNLVCKIDTRATTALSHPVGTCINIQTSTYGLVNSQLHVHAQQGWFWISTGSHCSCHIGKPTLLEGPRKALNLGQKNNGSRPNSPQVAPHISCARTPRAAQRPEGDVCTGSLPCEAIANTFMVQPAVRSRRLQTLKPFAALL